MKVLINDYKVNVSGVGLVYEALTPLQIACACDDIEIVQILIEAGADVEATNGGGRIPLHIAASMG